MREMIRAEPVGFTGPQPDDPVIFYTIQFCYNRVDRRPDTSVTEYPVQPSGKISLFIVFYNFVLLLRYCTLSILQGYIFCISIIPFLIFLFFENPPRKYYCFIIELLNIWPTRLPDIRFNPWERSLYS